MTETDLQLGGGYTYQWECAILLALNYFYDPVRYNPTLFDLVREFLGEVAEIHLEEDRESGVDLEDINLVRDQRRILVQVKTKQVDWGHWTPSDPLLLKAIYRFYDCRFLDEQPDDVRFVFLTNRPFNRDLVQIQAAIRAGTLDDCPEADKLLEHLQREKDEHLDAGRFRRMLARSALVKYLDLDAVKANVQRALQAYGRSDWREAYAVLFEHFARTSTRLGGGIVTRASIGEVLGPGLQPVLEAGPAPFTVPFMRNPGFVGRQKDLDRLHAALQAPGAEQPSRVGLTGMGGVGKTQIAVEYTFLHRNSYPAGVFWIDAAEPLAQGFATLGRLLRPELSDAPREEKIGAATDYLRAHPDSLLVFDNVSNPAQLKVPVLSTLIPAGLPCHILYTTRRHEVDTFKTIEVHTLDPRQSLRLLLRHETRQPILDTSHPEHEDAKSICAILGDLPLALEIAGAHLARRTKMALTVYLQELIERGALPVVDDKRGRVQDEDLGTRHRAAVEATLIEQWDMLESDDARMLLRVAGQLPEAAITSSNRLGVLAGLSDISGGFFDSPLASAVQDLVDLSLLELLAVRQVRVHPLVHNFAARQTPALEATTFRHWCATNMATAYDDFVRLESECTKRGIEELREDLAAGQALLFGHTNVPHRTQQVINSLLLTLKSTPGLHDWNAQLLPVLFAQQVHNQAVIAGCNDLASAARERLDQLKQPYLALRWRGSNTPDIAEPPRENIMAFRGRAIIPSGPVPISIARQRFYRHSMSASNVTDLSAHVQLGGLASEKNVVLEVKQQISNPPTKIVLRIMNKSDLDDSSSPPEVIEVKQQIGEVEEDGKVIGIDVKKLFLTLDPEDAQAWASFFAETRVAVDQGLQYAVAASPVGRLKIWDLQTGRPLHTLAGHTAPVTALDFTNDGTCLVSGSLDATVKVWDIQTGNLKHDLVSHTSGVTKVLVRQGSGQAISASQDSTLSVWHLATGNLVDVFEEHSGPISDFSLFSNERSMVTASWDTTLRVWNLEGQRCLLELTGHSDAVHSISVLPGTQKAVSASADGSLRVWNLETGACEQSLVVGAAVYSVKAIPNSECVLFVSENGLAMWNLRERAEQSLTQSMPVDVGILCRGSYVVQTGGRGSELAILGMTETHAENNATGNPNDAQLGHQVALAVVNSDVSRIAVSKDAETFLVGDTFGNVYCFSFREAGKGGCRGSAITRKP